MRRWVLGVLLAAGCTVELHDEPGRACDLAHPCGPNRLCLGGLCLPPPTPDGGTVATDGGTPATDAGHPLVPPNWNQLVHGFTGTTVEPGCSLVIDPTRGNKVSATAPGPDDAHDTASADMTDPARLPTTREGRLRGRLTLSGPLHPGQRLAFAWLGSLGGTRWLELAFDAQGRLEAVSDPGTMSALGLDQRIAVGGGFGPGDWVVDVTWRPGDRRAIAINGVELGSVPLPADGSPNPPGELRLGLLSVEGDAGVGASLALTSWQLADSADANLGDLP